MDTKPDPKEKKRTQAKEKLVSFLLDPDIQREFDGVLKKHFPRFDASKSKDKDEVLMMLLHRDAAESFLEKLYETASVPKPRKVLMPKQIDRR